MRECSKSMTRRLRDDRFTNWYFVGSGIDIGGRPDPLTAHRASFPKISAVDIWDIDDGDAQFMAGVPDERYDFVHSSHCLEHLRDPAEGLRNWFRIVKPGGHLIVTIPDEDMYEQGIWPSTFNTDHKWTFTLHKPESWSPRSVNLTNLLSGLGAYADIRKLEMIDSTYRFDINRYDQTILETTESSIEFVIRKRYPHEVRQKGRFPAFGIGPELTAARKLFSDGNSDGAQTAFQAIIRQDPYNPFALEGLAILAMQAGDRQKAAALLQRAIGHAGNIPSLAENLVRLLNRAGYPQLAIQSCNRLLAHTLSLIHI